MSGFSSVGVGGTIETGEIIAKSVTYPKIQDVTATNRLLGRVTSGSGVVEELTPANVLGIIGIYQDVYAAGTAYSLTNTSAALTFGTTSPTLTLDNTGTYRIRGRVNLKYNAATFAAVRTVTLKFRRTNNTAADLTNSTITFLTDIITLRTYSAGIILLPEISYSATSGDIITIFGDVEVVPTAGSLDVVEASINAQQVA